ncbi:uncharacterized protein LOC129289989 [Prosopis cineraria]|uniref:uncharacterized protein LOC129289989 n=1 Tax=Prosopis cineraria TaxID=364024 RepID=UPI00240EEEE4|nr:uncharacterized protein LOC129289989 [Prosopis cineraria]
MEKHFYISRVRKENRALSLLTSPPTLCSSSFFTVKLFLLLLLGHVSSFLTIGLCCPHYYALLHLHSSIIIAAARLICMCDELNFSLAGRQFCSSPSLPCHSSCKSPGEGTSGGRGKEQS